MLEPIEEQRASEHASQDFAAEAVKAVQFGDLDKLVQLVDSRWESLSLGVVAET